MNTATLQRGSSAAAREPLVPVDHVVVAVADDATRDVGGVARRDPGLRHREARTDLAVEQRLQPLVLLQLRAELGEDLHVAGVGRGAVGGFAEQRRRAHDLAQRRVLEVGEAGAVLGLGRGTGSRGRGLAGLGLQLLHDRRREVRIARLDALGAVHRLGRAHDLVVERDEHLPHLVAAGARCKLHWGLLYDGSLGCRKVRCGRPLRPPCLRDPTLRSVTDTPLAGVRVLELGAFIAGPFAGQLLGDLGADVVKIEPPGPGDIMRRYGVCVDGRSVWWPQIARNKRSVAIDLRDPRGRDLARRIAASCDVVLENFKPGTLVRWGLDYATLAADNPGVVLVHVSGFGQSGPRSAEPGFGSIGEAMGGIRHTTGDADRPPARTGVSIGDSLAGLFAVVGTLAALNERSRSGGRPGGRRRDLRSRDGVDGIDGRRLRARGSDTDAFGRHVARASRPRTPTPRSTAATS